MLRPGTDRASKGGWRAGGARKFGLEGSRHRRENVRLRLAQDRPCADGTIVLETVPRVTYFEGEEMGLIVVRQDGLEIFISSNRPGGIGGNDIWMSTRRTTSVNFGSPVNSLSSYGGSHEANWFR